MQKRHVVAGMANLKSGRLFSGKSRLIRVAPGAINADLASETLV